jgi:hypothetical protein
MRRSTSPDHPLRSILLGILALGVVGAGVELVLLGHFEGGWQRLPLLVLVAGLVAAILVAVRPGRPTLVALRGVMVASVLAGILGIWRHYRGNVEFELEMYPSIGGIELFQKAVTGATPALSPGAVVLLGLLGLALTYGHPALGGTEEPN